MLDGERWARVQSLFHEAADRPAGERRAWLEAACPGDPGLIAEVLGLLEEDARASLLDRPLAEVAHHLLHQGPAASLPKARFGPYRIREILG